MSVEETGPALVQPVRDCEQIHGEAWSTPPILSPKSRGCEDTRQDFGSPKENP